MQYGIFYNGWKRIFSVNEYHFHLLSMDSPNLPKATSECLWMIPQFGTWECD